MNALMAFGFLMTGIGSTVMVIIRKWKKTRKFQSAENIAATDKFLSNFR